LKPNPTRDSPSACGLTVADVGLPALLDEDDAPSAVDDGPAGEDF
jgi:hypothetical protein